MKQDKFLSGILIGIAALVLLALIVFFLRRDGPQYGAEDTPEGVVRNYIVAVRKEEYERAYSYLADLPNKPSLAEFRQEFKNGNLYPQSSGVDVLSASISGDSAYVELSIAYSSSDPFSSGGRGQDNAELLLQNGQWKLSRMANPFWFYSWYQKP